MSFLNHQSGARVWTERLVCVRQANDASQWSEPDIINFNILKCHTLYIINSSAVDGHTINLNGKGMNDLCNVCFQIDYTLSLSNNEP